MDAGKGIKRAAYVLALLIYSVSLWSICAEMTEKDMFPEIDTLQSDLIMCQDRMEDQELEIERLNRQLLKNGVIAREWRQLYHDRADAIEDDVEWYARELLISGDPKVYTEPGSEFYHREGCPRLGSVSVAINLSAAAGDGMRPCPDCEPIIYEPIA